MSKKILMVLMFIFSFCFISNVKATTINSIDTTVKIDENGNGHVTEVWNMDVDEGTEIYHSFGQMDERTITNFNVKMDKKNYQALDSWNVNASKEEKAYKNGINPTDNGLELCWGVEYGLHTYTVTYTVNNLVWQYDANQIIYFAFLPQNMKQSPNEFNLTIEADQSLNDVKYSSYGFESKNEIVAGKVKFNSTRPLDTSEYVVVVVGFPQNTFNLSVIKEGSYTDVAKDALDGATYEEQENFLFPVLIFGAIVAAFITIGISYSRKQDKYNTVNFVIPSKVNNFRDIPFKKDIMQAYFIGERVGLIKKENLMGAFLLKWIKEEKLTMVPTEGGRFDFNKDDNYYLDLNKLGTFADVTESELAEFLLLAADANKQLTPKFFKKWCEKEYEKINNWLDSAKTRSRSYLIKNNYIELGTEGKNNRKVYTFTNKLQEETIKLKGLKQFLNDMTLIDDKKAIEVHMWDEYLIFAQLFGIADKVAKQFKDFHPIEYQDNFYLYNNIFWVTHFSTMSTSAAMTALSAASSGGSFSGGGFGGGGFSAGGGGAR